MWSLFIWDLAARNTQYDRDADHYATEYTEQAEKDIRETCPDGEASDVPECIASRIRAERETYRNERDLAAQQKMAAWALGVLLVSGLTLAITTLGVGLVC
jgi:hypothetical protein